MPDPYRLSALRRAADKRRKADNAYRSALVEAREAGASLAQLGTAAGVARQTVWKALQRTEGRKP